MESGILPALISFFLPGIGQAATDGRTPYKWVIVFVVYFIITFLIENYVSLYLGVFIGLIIRILLAYDAYAEIIDIDNIF